MLLVSRRIRLVLVIFLALLSVPQECAAGETSSPRIRLATTTSTDNSGLLEYLMPHFKEDTGITVDVIAVGTGKALKLAERGDVDVIIVHAPEAERVFIEAGLGMNRRALMVNDFLIVGPPDDPSGLKGAGSVAEALTRLIKNEGTFVSRGDDSGTHKKERTLWPLAYGKPEPSHYLESGQGMEATLRITDENGAYTLTDRGTFLALRGKLDLVPVYESYEELENPYSIIVVNPARHRHVKYQEAMRLLAWLTSREGQFLIGAFRVDGEILFHPTAVPLEER